MLVVTLFFVSLRLLQIPYFLQGLLLISMAMAILIYQYMVTHRNSVRKGKATQRIKSTHKYIRQYAHYPFGFLVMVLMSAVIGIAVGGYQVILAVQELAVMYDLSQTVLGLTLVAVSTSLPELITILVAKVNHDDEVMVGTILGSNMYNLGLFAGLLSLNQVGSYLTKIDFIFLITSAMLMTFMLLFYAGRKIPRVWGVASIFLFLIFVAQAFILPLL
jgi:cation:H+ antiporter